MRSNHFSQRRSMARACVQSLGASIFQLINFIFTHLFLNVLSDGNAAGCSSEVLTRQMGLKGEVSQCQRQDFNSNLRDPFSFYYSWKVRIISAKSAEHTWSPTVLLIQYKKKHFNSSSCSKANWHYFSDGEEWFLSFFHSAFDGFKLPASLWQQNLVCASFKCKCNRGALRKIRRWFETHSRQMLEWIFEATCVIFTQHQHSLTSKCVTAQNTSPF